MKDHERFDLIHLLSFISGRTIVFYEKKSNEELQEEYKRLTTNRQEDARR